MQFFNSYLNEVSTIRLIIIHGGILLTCLEEILCNFRVQI